MGVETKNHCLGQTLRAAAHGLRLGPGIRRKIWVKGADWVEDTERLMPLVEALPVPEPHSTVEAIAQTGTSAFLRTECMQAAICDWGTAHQIPGVLRWFVTSRCLPSTSWGVSEQKPERSAHPGRSSRG